MRIRTSFSEFPLVGIYEGGADRVFHNHDDARPQVWLPIPFLGMISMELSIPSHIAGHSFWTPCISRSYTTEPKGSPIAPNTESRCTWECSLPRGASWGF